MEFQKPNEEEINKLTTEIDQYENEMREIDQKDKEKEPEYITIGGLKLEKGELVSPPVGKVNFIDRRRWDSDGNPRDTTETKDSQKNLRNVFFENIGSYSSSYDIKSSEVEHDELEQRYRELDELRKPLVEERKKMSVPEEIKQIAYDYLTYHDLDYTGLEEDEKNHIEEMVQDEITKIDNGELRDNLYLYTDELKKLIDAHGEDAIKQIADQLQQKFFQLADELKLFTPSVFSKSKTWIFWDIAKQSYLSSRPWASSKEYRLANPMKDEQVQQEIVNRHLGWEIYANGFRKDDDNFFNNDEFHYIWESPHAKEIRDLIEKQPKENSNPPDLSSADLAKLGALVRSVIEEKLSTNP